MTNGGCEGFQKFCRKVIPDGHHNHLTSKKSNLFGVPSCLVLLKKYNKRTKTGYKLERLSTYLENLISRLFL